MMKYKEIAQKYLTRYKPSVFDFGPASRLPEEYRKFWREWWEAEPQPVHYIPQEGIWRRTQEGEIKRIENVPLPGRIPKELHNIITGGEMVIQGFKQKHRRARRVPQFWVPTARQSVIYSEVLDKHISVLLTDRAVNLILEHQGFDSYVLKTKACDLRSAVTLKLKRIILLALRDNNLPYDEEKNKEIYKKYEQYMMPPEEIEWYGLTISEAVDKLRSTEASQRIKQAIPLKHVYRQQLINDLKLAQIEKSTEKKNETEDSKEANNF